MGRKVLQLQRASGTVVGYAISNNHGQKWRWICPARDDGRLLVNPGYYKSPAECLPNWAREYLEDGGSLKPVENLF